MPIDPITGAAILSTVGSGISGYLNAQASTRNTRLTNAANSKLAEYAYSKDLDMWNRANQYNAPGAQMERLRSAGLNPNLVYGTGVTGNTSGSLPKYNAPQISHNFRPQFDPGAMLGQVSNLVMAQAQANNLNAQTDNTKAQTINAILQSGIIKDTGTIKALEAHFAPQLMRTQLDASKAGVEQSRKSTQVMDADLRLKQIEEKWRKEGMSGSDQIQWRALYKALEKVGALETIDELPDNVKSIYEIGKKVIDPETYVPDKYKGTYRKIFKPWQERR